MTDTNTPATSTERCFVIAEAGVNHNGSEEIAKQLIDAACAAGANAVKFQTFRVESLVTPNADKADYQKQSTGAGKQFSMLQKLELSEDAHIRLADYCKKNHIEFMSTAFDQHSAAFLFRLGIRRIKIPSGELTNLPLIRYLAAQDLPIILSTGMATLDEVGEAVSVIKSCRAEHGLSEPLADRLMLLHCTSNYPTELANVNLNAMRTLASAFELPVGYSDHTAGLFVAPLAVALGAKVIEKHFTLDSTMSGPDHKASLEPNQLIRFVSEIRAAETSLGNWEKTPTKTELEVRKAARRSITLNSDVTAGQVLTASDLTLLRPGDGIPPRDLDKVIGQRVLHKLARGHTLRWAELDR